MSIHDRGAGSAFIKFVLVIGFYMACCTRGYLVGDRDICRSLETQGYVGCVIQERHEVLPAWNGCGGSDAVAMSVSTRNPRDQQVTVTVCCGWPTKGCTIRTE